MPFSNHQFSLRCLFSWEVPQIDCCQCLSRDQYRFMAILKNDTEKRKKKQRRLVCSTSSYLHFFSFFFVCYPLWCLEIPFFGSTKYPHQKPGDEEFSFTVTSHWCCNPKLMPWEIPKKTCHFYGGNLANPSQGHRRLESDRHGRRPRHRYRGLVPQGRCLVQLNTPNVWEKKRWNVWKLKLCRR